MTYYKKLPVMIEAKQWTGENVDEIIVFCQSLAFFDKNLQEMTIATLEGKHIASIGDFIIKGIKGEFYPCKPDIFEKTYVECDSLGFLKGEK